jgi:hypothetical protein
LTPNTPGDSRMLQGIKLQFPDGFLRARKPEVEIPDGRWRVARYDTISSQGDGRGGIGGEI